MTEPTLSGLAAAIAKATIEVGGFVADKRNNEQNYAYISADAVLERGGLALARVGVAVIPAVTTFDIKFTARANKSDRIDALVNFVMTVCYQGEKFETPWVGCGSDYSTPDKALYKAITSGHKYYLMKLLNISIGNEDSEHDTEDEPKRTAPVKPAPDVSRTPEAAKDTTSFNNPPADNSTNVSQPKVEGNGKNSGRPYAPEALKKAITKQAGTHIGKAFSDGARGLMVGQLDALFGGDVNKRHQFTKYVTAYPSTKNMPANICQSLLDWMKDEDMARREANGVIAFLDGENGQLKLA